MIIKIVYHEALGVVAKVQTMLISNIEEAQYEKVTFANAEELDDLVEKFEVHDEMDTWYGPKIPEEDCQMEAILMRMWPAGRSYLGAVAICASVYFMNDGGKTIDKVECLCIARAQP